MYSKFRTVESILVIAEFTIPVLAILGLQKLLTTKFTDLHKFGLIFGFSLPILICFIGLIKPAIFGDVVTDKEVEIYNSVSPMLTEQVIDIRHGMIQDDSLRSLMFLLVAGGALALFLYNKINMWIAIAVIGLDVTADLYSVNKRYVNHESFCTPELSADNPLAPNAVDQQILADKDPNFRVMSIPEFSSPRPSYHHKMIGGYHAAKLTRYQDLIDHQISNGNPEVLNMLNAKYIIDNQWNVMQNPRAYGNAWLVDKIDYVATPNEEMAALDSISSKTAVADNKFEKTLGKAIPTAAGDTIFEKTYAPNKLTYEVNSKNGGIAVFSEVYFPWGWNATIDGKEAEIGRVNYVLRAMKVPAGKHEIVMTFDPQSLHTTTSIATVAIILIYLSLAGVIAWALIKLPNPVKEEEKK